MDVPPGTPFPADYRLHFTPPRFLERLVQSPGRASDPNDGYPAVSLVWPDADGRYVLMHHPRLFPLELVLHRPGCEPDPLGVVWLMTLKPAVRNFDAPRCRPSPAGASF